eukprot:SAG31_NODE_5588_length_2439_cov_1.964530_1_plen_29_part_10
MWPGRPREGPAGRLLKKSVLNLVGTKFSR